MSPPGIYVRGATTALTRRTTMRKGFLSPWHPLVELCWLYDLADAQANTGMGQAFQDRSRLQVWSTALRPS